MLEADVILQELHLDGAGLVGGSIARLPRLVLRPGQYLLGHAAGSAEPIPYSLFPANLAEETIRLAPYLPPAWQPGQTLRVRGPFGRGFHLPPLAHRVALIAPTDHPFRLLPLLSAALAQGAEVVLCAAQIPSWLPDSVEVLDPSSAPEAAAWADYIAVDLAPAHLGSLARILGLKPIQARPASAEVLLVGPMPCGGTAECGVCAVKTRAGWRLACKDGPVFLLKDLESR
jgi:NAD(P)H-flavin reductase